MLKAVIMMNHIATPQMLLALSVISEIFGVFRVHPICYAFKVCIDMPKEVIKLMVLSK